MSVNDSKFLTEILGLSSFFEDLNTILINMYEPNSNKFLYCNACYDKIVNTDIKSSYNKDWNSWFSLIPLSQRLVVKKRLFSFFKNHAITKTLTIRYSIISNGENYVYKHKCTPVTYKKQRIILSYFKDISEEQKIERFLNTKVLKKYISEQCSNGMISLREKQVLQLIADGFSSKQVADRLFISNHTAISHRKHLIEKFKVKNTAQLIKEASKVIEL